VKKKSWIVGQKKEALKRNGTRREIVNTVKLGIPRAHRSMHEFTKRRAVQAGKGAHTVY